MKITPIDIRQKNFEKKFRGYDVDEVNAFLHSLSNEWQRLQDENRELRMRYENAEREVQKLREVENTLFKTLKTAEETGNNIIDQANKQAELILMQAKVEADALINEAKNQSKALILEAEEHSKLIVKNAQEELKAIHAEQRELEIKKENVLQELKNIANDLNDRIERYKSKNKIELFNKFDDKKANKGGASITISKESAVVIAGVKSNQAEKQADSDTIEMQNSHKVDEEKIEPSFFDMI
jgi:cell division initiation protein